MESNNNIAIKKRDTKLLTQYGKLDLASKQYNPILKDRLPIKE